MVKTGAEPEAAIVSANKKAEILSAAGDLIINSSPSLKGGQVIVNAIARSGSFETVKEMAKEQIRGNQ